MASINEAEMPLPEDMVMLILSRLPVKTLLRFKSVSKYWYSLIQNPTFISLHHSHAHPNDCLLATRQTVSDGYLFNDDPVFSMHLAPDQTSSVQELDLSFSGVHNGDGAVEGVFFLGCHNGVMCLANDVTSTIVVINPATRESRVLPQPLYESKHRSYLGFTFDPKANDYKVIRFCSILEFMPFLSYCDQDPDYKEVYSNYRGDQKVQIYDLSSDSWRETNAVVPIGFPHGRDPHCCTSLNGVFYWFGGYLASRRVRVISAFRTFEEVFEPIPLPDGIGIEAREKLCLLHDSLALVMCRIDNRPVGETRVDIWLMDEYGVDKCWTKRYSIGPLLGSHYVLGFRPNIEILLENFDNLYNRRMVSYNLSTHEVKEYNQLCDRQNLWMVALQVFPYAESLISVKRHVD